MACKSPLAAARQRRWLAGVLLALLLAGCAGPELRTQSGGGQAGLSIERALILASAKQALGTPYRYGGETLRGLDCSGLVQMAYAAAGIAVPRTADQQFSQLAERDVARPGDLLFFGWAPRPPTSASTWAMGA